MVTVEGVQLHTETQDVDGQQLDMNTQEHGLPRTDWTQSSMDPVYEGTHPTMHEVSRGPSLPGTHSTKDPVYQGPTESHLQGTYWTRSIMDPVYKGTHPTRGPSLPRTHSTRDPVYQGPSL